MSRPPAATSPSDRALTLAAIAFDGPGGDRLWHRFAPAWRDHLRAAWADALARGIDGDAARDALARAHAAESRPDPARVHPSWWARALDAESPAVRAAVLTHAPEPIRATLRDALGLRDAANAPAPGPAAHPDALRWALALWAERLVGGPPPGDDDPPVVVAVATLPHRDLNRLIAAVALAKWAYVLASGGPPTRADPDHALTARQLERLGRLRARWDATDPRAAQLARLDLDHHVVGEDQEDLRKLGLITFARLLARVDPHRTRWTLQHLPYPAAKFVRSRSGLKTPFLHGRELVAWEETLFQAAQEALRDEARHGPASDPESPTHPEGEPA